MRLSETHQIVPLLEPADYQAGSQDLDSINMGLAHNATIIIQTGAITGNDAYIKLWVGASAGTKTTEIAFTYRLSTVDTGSASADVFGDPVTTVVATGIAFAAAASWDHRTILIEIDSQAVPAATPWLTVETDDGSASTLFLSAVAIVQPRYPAHTEATVL